jgi:hypothetical protein
MRKAEISIALHNLGIFFGVGGLRAELAEDHRLACVAPVIVRFGGKPPRRSVKDYEASSLGSGGRIWVKVGRTQSEQMSSGMLR